MITRNVWIQAIPETRIFFDIIFNLHQGQKNDHQSQITFDKLSLS